MAGKTVNLNLYTIAILLHNVYLGKRHPKVGFEDADRTFEMLSSELSRIISLPASAVESALWSSNLLDENKAFSHPENKTFDEFLESVMGQVKYRYQAFDKDYNFFVEKKGEVPDET